MIKRVIVTGASGFIGKALTTELLRRGVSVCAVTSEPEKLRQFFSNPAFCTLTAARSYDSMLQLPGDADICFHLAWSGVSDKDYGDPHVQLRNCDLACAVAEEVSRCGCKKMVFIGSTHEYQNIYEDGCIAGRKLTAYGSAKHCAAELCMLIAQQAGFSFSVAQLPNVYGVGDFSRRSTNTILLQFLEHATPKLIPGGIPYDCINIDDAVRGVIVVGEKGTNGMQYYLGNRTIRPFEETVTAMRDAVDPSIELDFGALSTAVVTDYTKFDLERAWEEFGYEPVSDLRESMKKTAEWLRENRARFD